MANIFDSVQQSIVPTNRFDLTHDVKLSCQMGLLTPICTFDTLPGDKINLSAESVVRMAPLVSTLMHRVDITIHYWWCANYLIWPNWDDFISGKVEHGVPFMNLQSTLDGQADGVKSLSNYLGIPTTIQRNYTVSPMAHAAYQMIYNEWYRDQNLIPKVPFELTDGLNDNPELKILRRRAWEHDYFTSALPFAQAGSPVDLPLGDIKLKDQWPLQGYPTFQASTGSSIQAGNVTQNTNGVLSNITIPPSASPSAYDPHGTLTVEPTTVNDLRRAFALQEYLEKAARGGRRAYEWLKTFWNVNSRDRRYQSPQYITGVKSPIVISEVLNTSGKAGTPEMPELPQGAMTGHGIGVTSGKPGSFYADDFGWVIGIMSIMPKTAYYQGLPRMFNRKTVFDYPNPVFANLGEQEVLNKELYIDSLNPNGTFGYLPRYSEMKYLPNRVAGDFQQSLDHWHMARHFANEPALNKTFIECTPRTDPFAVQAPGEDLFYCHILNKINVSRKLPFYGTPSKF